MQDFSDKLELRFAKLNVISDLEKIIFLTKKVLKTISQNSIELEKFFNSLIDKLQRRFQRLDTLVDFEEVINLTKRAMKITSQDNSYVAEYINNLDNKFH